MAHAFAAAAAAGGGRIPFGCDGAGMVVVAGSFNKCVYQLIFR